jgi:N,N'-diacetyllegionaminate synthase
MSLSPFIEIAARRVGSGNPCFVIAEVAQAHDGSLGTAHAYIDAVAKTGVDAVKFQTHIAAAESTPSEQFRVKFSRQDATRYDYWRRMEFTTPQWRELAQHARDAGLIFLSTPFSLEACDLLEDLHVPAWKVGSGELTNLPMLKHLAQTRKPVILSSGMASWEELDTAVAFISPHTSVAVMQCTTTYPCPPEKVGLNVLGEIRDRYRLPVGLSDHSGTIYAGLAAVALGVNLLEVHVVFSRECFGPDVPASITTEELRQLVDGVRFVEHALASPIDKQQISTEMTDLKILFGKSVVASRDLPSGHTLSRADLALRKPGSGIPAARLDKVVGRRLRQSVAANTILSEADFD